MVKYILGHKIVTFFIILVLLGGGYYAYGKFGNKKEEKRYLTARVERGAITVSVSGSGQVSTSNQMDVKPKASGDVVVVPVKNGQHVRAGALLAQLDSRDAQKAVRDAEANLASALLALEKLQKPAEALTILQAEHALAQSKESKQRAEDDLAKAYEDGFNAVANAFLDLPTIMTSLQDITFGTTLVSGQWNIDYYTNAAQAIDEKIIKYRTTAVASYEKARAAYDASLDKYKAASRFSSRPVVKALIDDTYETTKSIAEAIKDISNVIQFYKDKLTDRNLKVNALAETHLASLNTHTGKTNTILSNLLALRRTIQTNDEAIVNADRTIAERIASLEDVKAGADALDVESQKLSIQQRQNTLTDAREKLADYFVRAPFDGVVAEVNVKRGDPVSASTVIATLITTKRIAEITLNEVDVAKVAVGQKATLTFDAIAGLNITGVVAKIDTVGTVAQGVVSYTVEITFDTQDERVKPGMSVSASIITDAKTGVLLVPNGAVKSQGSVYRVDVMEATVPRRQKVEIGLANDDVTEIISGLSEGEIVVTGTINTNSTTNTNQNQTSGFRIPGLPGGGQGGGNIRGGGR